MSETAKKIRVLKVVFDTEIKSYEVPAFRGAIIEKVGRENTLFHHHLGDETFLYKYPIIQYKQIGRKPAIICIDQGVDEIHKYFESRSWDIEISGRVLEMKIDQLNLNTYNMQVWDKKFRYSIYNWVALNQENYKKYMEMEDLVERIKFLESTLTGNIISFAKGIDWTIDKQIEMKISDIRSINKVIIKEKPVIGFDVIFTTNVFLPNYIGLGKSVNLGYGIVKEIRNTIN